MKLRTLRSRPIITPVGDVAGRRTVLAVFPTGCTPIKGPLSSTDSPDSEKKSEESESFIYIRDILFILADKFGLAPGSS